MKRTNVIDMKKRKSPMIAILAGARAVKLPSRLAKEVGSALKGKGLRKITKEEEQAYVMGYNFGRLDERRALLEEFRRGVRQFEKELEEMMSADQEK